ncbi:MAG: quercetin 2,3-dioxygenase [Thiomicrorhabdus sp.]|nr:MAG: quercetin 2,3-dioxygenase [Thiomicrorhabdus sp.]
MPTEILHRNDLPLGGFAGLKEYRLVMQPDLFKGKDPVQSWTGLGNFVYLADAHFNPNGETKMHSHKEVDIISIMLDGRIEHKGTLEDGQVLKAGMVQVQRAGGKGFKHNEINPDDSTNRMLQLWVLPEEANQETDYKLYQTKLGQVTQVYGGPKKQSETITSHTMIEVASLSAEQTYQCDKPFIAYVTKGHGTANKLSVKEGDLIRGESLDFLVLEGADLVVIYLRK